MEVKDKEQILDEMSRDYDRINLKSLKERREAFGRLLDVMSPSEICDEIVMRKISCDAQEISSLLQARTA